MKSSSKLLYGIAVFLGLMAVIYIVGTGFVQDDANRGGTEWVGVVALVLSTALAVMLGVYLHFTDSRADVLPEDWEEAEVEDKAGILGFFSPGSIYPAWMAGAVGLLGLGIAFWHFWLMALGAVLLIWGSYRLNMQYGMPKEAH
ncbi:aa3-type cytochrome oxidase subunit IV [Corynebacterium comes]|uniref:Cytochrome c oxidase polypeptide 4 n=1 Tax=Corynebacterium comes TaxID=2675218 RepID=A0A6B8W102_9CORY|nr:cytochrome c oxidase subunit 4 [Corynebacterium comes]QGU05035.1 Cytochrome c oxidase polypeptide 4 [Corynebacterium comes]